MPNWAFGKVEVTGTRKGVKSFIERFISNDDPSTVPGKRFFARSFMNEKRQRRHYPDCKWVHLKQFYLEEEHNGK